MDKTVFDSYWANDDSTSLISILSQKVSDFDRHIDMSGRWLTYRDLYYHYYLVNEQNYLFPNFGADGFKRLNINHFRAHLKHMLSLVTSQRSAPIPVATNSDHTSQAQTSFCKNILRYYEKEKQLEKTYEKATEMAIVLTGSFVSVEWDASLGEVYMTDPATQKALRKGDVDINIYTPLDCLFDFASSSWDVTNWIILRKYVNRWDLVEKFPTHADAIKSMSIAPEVKRHRLGHIINEKNDDLIPLYTFYHKKTSAMPNGRATLFLDSDICLFDGDLPYQRIPVSRITADEQINSPFPYSVSMDLLPLQKVYNALCSAVCTNQAAFGVQNILIPRESNISLAQLTEGLNALYYDPQITQGSKPEPLNLLATAPEVFKWIEYIEAMMTKVSGINDTIQGHPEANIKSGTAMAFVAAQALAFLSPLSRSYTLLMENTWTRLIDILKEFATTPRMVLISGISNRSEAKEFKNTDIANIDRVIVEEGNPLMQTTAGRIQIAENLLQGGLLNKEEYLTVVQTGQLEPIYAYEKEELLCIKRENEALQNGRPVKALITDNHPLHMREHLTLLSSPEARTAENNPIMMAILSHLQEHDNLWKTMPASFAAIQNIPPAPQPMMPPSGAPGTGPENPMGSKVPGAPNLPNVLNPKQGIAAQAGAIKAPNMPNLPPGSPAPIQAGHEAMKAALPK